VKTAPTIVCPLCDGTTFTLRPCRCRNGRGEFLFDYPAPAGPPDEERPPWPDCQVCHGDGTVSHGCGDCDQRGLRRAQIVLTVANLDTGQTASANLVPGAVEPIRSPNGRWLLALGPVLTDLATQADVAPDTLYDPDLPQRPVWLDGEDIALPHQWQPHLSTDQRHTLEATALARQLTTTWYVLLGRTTAPTPPDHARLLGRLCALADQLRVDLVIEARPTPSPLGPSWDIRFELPASGVPAEPHQRADDLYAAIATTTIEQAAAGLDHADRSTPAHYLDPVASPTTRHTPPAGERPTSAQDVDLLERRIIRDCDGTPGAQAIWRDQHWWHTTLRPDEPTETLMELETGQVARRITPTLRRGWEPPAPRHHGEPIPTTPCRGCHTTGTGTHGLPCHHCKGAGRLHHGAVLTITDLNGRHVHINWRPDDDTQPPAALVATYASGVPVLQLPPHYQIRRWAPTFHVHPEDLTTLDGEHVIDQYHRDGIVHLLDPTADPIHTYLTNTATGRPGARIIVRANTWPGPSLNDLTRLALSLGLAVDITVIDHRLNTAEPHLIQGVGWAVNLVNPDTPIGHHPDAHQRSLPEAVAYCLRYLGSALRATTPHDPDQPIPIPQRPAPLTDDEIADLLNLPDTTNLAEPVRRLAANHPGRPATARLHTTGYHTTITD